MAGGEGSQTTEQAGTSRPATGRPVVYSTEGVISSGHYLTSMAGARMLVSGGNAFDALAAACFAAAVVEPLASYSLAAEGVFMLYHAESGDLVSLSGQGVAPRRATVEFYRSQGLDAIPTGPGPQAHLSFTVPGIVDALVSMLDRYGTKTIADVLEPSIRYAEQGIPNYEYMIQSLDNPVIREQFRLYPPGGTDVFYPDGELPGPGSMLVQKAAGKTLKAMADAEGSASGDRAAGLRAAWDVFYEGEVARTIVEGAKHVGGVLEMEDLAEYHARFAEPVKTEYRGYEVDGHSTWTQGPVLLQALNILERFDLKGMGHNSPAYIHTVAEAIKLAMADRQAYYGDPEYTDVPLDELLSKEYAAQRAKQIDPTKAWPELPSFGKITGGGPSIATASTAAGASPGDEGGTTHASVIDRDGNIACATPSGGGFVKSVYIPELGYSLSTRIEMFNFEEGHPNVLVPGKRPRTTLVNYIVSKDGRPRWTFGCPGGDHQAQANLQLMLNTLLFGMNPQEAIEAPRFATESVVNSFYPHVYFPGRLSVEPGIPSGTVDALKGLGHEVVTSVTCGMGATVSHRDPDTGVLSSGGDPRRASYAIGL